jgi:hypothetical protein
VINVIIDIVIIAIVGVVITQSRVSRTRTFGFGDRRDDTSGTKVDNMGVASDTVVLMVEVDFYGRLRVAFDK